MSYEKLVQRFRIDRRLLFWGPFWITIALLVALTIYAQMVEIFKAGRLQADTNGIVRVSPHWQAEFDKLVDALNGVRKVELDETARRRIHAAIEQKVDEAFTPAYAQIPTVADFHFSVVGEYTTLLAAVAGEAGEKLSAMLLNEAESRLKSAAEDINADVVKTIGDALSVLHEKLNAGMSPSSEELVLLQGILTLTSESLQLRFGPELLALRVGGAGLAAAFVSGKIAGGKVATSIGAKVSVKMAAKAGAKTAAKLAGVGAAGGAGAFACGPLGWVCGPVAAGVAWLTLDYGIIKLEELFSRAEFEAELRGLVDAQKQTIKQELIHRYDAVLDAVSTRLETGLEGLAGRGVQHRSPAESVKAPPENVNLSRFSGFRRC